VLGAEFFFSALSTLFHAMKKTWIGISGWAYAGWRGRFYPKGLGQKRELEFAAKQFNSIEINGSFYSLQRPESYRGWHEQTPEEFVFAVKGGRFITHMKKLVGVEEAMANFFASGVLALREKLGPILWQFPPILKFEKERVERFFGMLPRDMKEAGKLARKHGERMEGRSYTRVDENRPMRHAVEVRHPSFLQDEALELMRRYGVALVLADTAGRWPYAEEMTGDFVYIRLHGSKEIYASGYSDSELDWWAERIRRWGRRREVYVYFDNDAKVQAPFDAMRLAERVR
jgi:uncharacterized protein YecE (DUF72 family)